MKNNKVAVVTGASSGIGETAVKRLLEAGYTTYAAARRVERMKGLEELGAILLPLDVTDDASIVSAVERVHAEQGRIDVLLNNAGYGSYGAVEDVPLEEARRQFEVNVFGLARLTQLFTPMMRTQGSGRILNISSIGGKGWEPLGAWYHATKFAVEGFSDCLRMELAPFGIDVVVIEPGLIRTEWAQIALDSLAQTSRNTAYAEQAEEKRLVFAAAYKGGSKPNVVARAVMDAVKAKRPKTRYAIGEMAGPSMFMARFFPDRLTDWLLTAMARNMVKQARRKTTVQAA